MSLFDAELMIVDRIAAFIPEFKSVGNPSMIASLKELGPLLPACIVMPGSGEITSSERGVAGSIELQAWSLIILVGHQYNRASNQITEQIAGDLMTACIKIMSSWDPAGIFIRNFVYAGREAPTYSMGYAEFPLLFHAKKMVGI